MSCWTSALMSPRSRRGPHRLDLGLERGHVAVEAARRLLRRELLERGAHRVDLDELRVAERPHARAPERLRLDHAAAARGRAAPRGPAPGSCRARWAIRVSTSRSPGFSSPLDDPLEQDVLDLLAEHRSGDRAHRGERRRATGLGHPATTGFVSEPTPVDLDRDLVAGLQQPRRVAEHADAGGRAGEDQVAGLERRRLRGVADDLVDPEDQVRGRRVLHRLAVQDRADPERVRIGDLRSRDERPDGAERVRRLAARPLAVGELEVARGDVVRDDVAGDGLEARSPSRRSGRSRRSRRRARPRSRTSSRPAGSRSRRRGRSAPSCTWRRGAARRGARHPAPRRGRGS